MSIGARSRKERNGSPFGGLGGGLNVAVTDGVLGGHDAGSKEVCEGGAVALKSGRAVAGAQCGHPCYGPARRRAGVVVMTMLIAALIEMGIVNFHQNERLSARAAAEYRITQSSSGSELPAARNRVWLGQRRDSC